MRRFSILLAVAVVASVLFLLPGIALGNMAIHGGYSEDTDSCAGCHRAHTATSPITWTNADDEQRSALLISEATSQYEFCFTCHGSNAAGAATNVWDGVYEGTAHGSLGNPINSGGFAPFIGVDDEGQPLRNYSHMYNSDETGLSWGAWGGGNTGQLPDDPNSILATGTGPLIVMTCGSCHDVHGSSNYRLLKDVLNVGGTPVTVGGYDPASTDPTNPDPWPFVISNEEGYPQEGWRLGDAGAAQMEDYVPNYTDPQYAKAPPADWDPANDPDPEMGISAWCSGCHTQYMSQASVYNANDIFDTNQWGLTMRYRHPVNSEMGNFSGARPLNWDLLSLRGNIPVAHSSSADVGTYDEGDWIDCLTCHRAHGSNSVMEGWATDQVEGWTTDTGADGPLIQYPGTKNSFLRLDNRGVCQQCHYK